MSAMNLDLLGRVQLSAHDGAGERLIALAPKPLALLAYLAVAGADGRPIRRDTLLALFWPELPGARARAALRQLLFHLRRALDGGGLRTDRESVAVAADGLSCDVVAFEQALARGDPATALQLYGGDLLAGFFVDGMSLELEQWMDRERARLRREAVRACWSLAERAERAHDGSTAARWAHRAVGLDPDDEAAVRRLVELLDRLGDRCGALRAADSFARRLAEAFGVAPSAETQALVSAVRARRPANAGPGEPAAAVALSPAAGIMAPPENLIGPGAAAADAAGSPRHRWRRAAVATASLVAVLTSGGLLGTPEGRGSPSSLPPGSADGSPTVTIASPVARRLYQEGLGRLYVGDLRESARLFNAALAEDSSCAMCAYYASVVDGYLGENAVAFRMVGLATRLAERASQPERLLIQYAWADATNSPARLAVAESLAARYPDWPLAQLADARALMSASRYAAAVARLRHVLAAHPLAASGPHLHCPACEAEADLLLAYMNADSLVAALRAAQGWVRAQPHTREPWLQLAHLLARSDRFDEARAALDSSTAYAAGSDDDADERAQIEIRAGNFPAADGLLRALAQSGTPETRADALWWLVISLRDQGRFRDALALAAGPLRRADSLATGATWNASLATGQVLFELGRNRAAAATFARLALPTNDPPAAAPGALARRRVWPLTHVGSALAAAADTGALALLADSVEVWGRASGLARDHHLHQYLRGLLWMARGQPGRAAAAYRAATMSETEGFSRLDYERARALLALRQPRNALPVLRHALQGYMSAGHFYVTRTELQELLARAYDAAGQPDSAAAYYRCVLHAWRHADPQLRPRVAQARTQLALDQRADLAAGWPLHARLRGDARASLAHR